MNTDNAFWLVWNPQRDKPRATHPTRASAAEEAERLAKKQPGERFYVLQAVSVSNTPPPVVTTSLRSP